MVQTSATTTVRVTATMAAVLSGPPDPLLDDDWTCGFDPPVTASRVEEMKMKMKSHFMELYI